MRRRRLRCARQGIVQALRDVLDVFVSPLLPECSGFTIDAVENDRNADGEAYVTFRLDTGCADGRTVRFPSGPGGETAARHLVLPLIRRLRSVGWQAAPQVQHGYLHLNGGRMVPFVGLRIRRDGRPVRYDGWQKRIVEGRPFA